MSQRNGGGNGGSGTSDGPPSPLDGLAGGAASADADTASMPPPPPRRKQPLQSSLNPLLVGATVVSASVPPLQSVNNGDSSTSTSTSFLLQPSKQRPPAPPPLAKRSRRGRIPLEKGFSQVEWLRRARERQVPPPREITPKELAEHSTAEDCWTALRGRVYDLTPYLKFHPGGMPLLVAVAGKDSTRVFDSYHAWVNAGALLASCLVGKLVEGEEGGEKAAVATVEEVEAAGDAAEAEALAVRAAAAAAAEAEAAAAALSSAAAKDPAADGADDRPVTQ